MIEYTYFEVFLMVAFFVVLGYALKYHEEAKSVKRFIKILLDEPEVYAKVKKEHDAFVKGLRNAD